VKLLKYQPVPRQVRAGRAFVGGLNASRKGQNMDMQTPPAQMQMAQAETQPETPAEPIPVKVDVTKYLPDTATSVTMIVTVSPPTGTAVVYAPGYENYATIFKGPRTMGDVRLAGPFVYVKLYGATSFDIQYTNYRQP
jgi:hypothetical protein